MSGYRTDTNIQIRIFPFFFHMRAHTEESKVTHTLAEVEEESEEQHEEQQQ